MTHKSDKKEGGTPLVPPSGNMSSVIQFFTSLKILQRSSWLSVPARWRSSEHRGEKMLLSSHFQSFHSDHTTGNKTKQNGLAGNFMKGDINRS
ncbi:hypothetical protein RRG08_005414 [Elysia crispata]|uniref:Uncharacterized protein n=1 Tax=Elysia crispata TaxID=231223 RepID=A0AAE1CQK0_9GAST|nr:hypothetical protein RRG08_005414 [Elysia crispata]